MEDSIQFWLRHFKTEANWRQVLYQGQYNDKELRNMNNEENYMKKEKLLKQPSKMYKFFFFLKKALETEIIV